MWQMNTPNIPRALCELVKSFFLICSPIPHRALGIMGGVHLPQKSTSIKCLFVLLFIAGSHFYVAPVFKLIPKNIFLHQIKAKGHDKGPQRPERQHALGGWIFSEFDYRHIEELKSKFWCTISHHLVLFQNWPNLLHKIMIFATLGLSFEKKPDRMTKTKGSSWLHIPSRAF